MNTDLSDPGVLDVCFATQESGGDTSDDYVSLSGNVTLRVIPDFTPKRTITGAAQVLVLTGASAGDQVAWVRYTGVDATPNYTYCQNTAGGATTDKTVALYGCWEGLKRGKRLLQSVGTFCQSGKPILRFVLVR